MRNYDEIEGFIDYTDKEAWEKYIENLVTLWKNAYLLKEFFESIKQEFHKLPFSSVKDEEKPLLLGGIIPNKEEIYLRSSLAKFYSKFFGLRIKDIQSWIISKQEEAPTEIEVEVVETDFIKFVKNIFSILDTALQHQQLVTNYIEPSLEYEILKGNPEKVKEIVKEFYQQLLAISVNYNYHTFFLWSINQVPRKFLKLAYSRIDEILEFLISEMGLTELKWSNPIKPKSKTFGDYTIHCFPEYNPNNRGKSFGGSICQLNRTIWEMLYTFSITTDSLLSMLFTQVPDLREEFREKTKTRVAAEYHRWIYYKGVTASEKSIASIEESNKSLMELLDENSPHLFLGLIYIDYLSDNSMSFAER